MKSFKDGFLSNGPLYSLIALYMPLATMTALVFLLKALIPPPLPPLRLLVSFCITALAASIYCDFMKETRASRTAANIRGGLIVMGITYILFSLFRWGIPWGKRFLPDITVVFASLGTIYTWASVISLKQLFSARKRLEAYMASYQGEQLYRALYEDADLLQYTDEEITKAKRGYLSQLIIIGIITIVGIFYKIYFPLPLYLLLIIILVGGICIFGFFGVIRWEHYCAAEGMSLSAFDRAKRMLGIAIFPAFSIVMAILLSSDKSLLPLSLITGFFDWFSGLFHTESLPVQAAAETDFFEPVPDIRSIVSPFDETKKRFSLPVWDWLKYGFIALVAAVFIWFMVSPLLNRGITPWKLRWKLGRIMAEWFKGIITAVASFFTLVRSKGTARKFRTLTAEEIRRAAQSIVEVYSPAKKRDMRRSVTLFARLIIWGGEVRQVLWKPAYAPGEYCGILAASTPPSASPEDSPDDASVLKRQNEGIIRCGELFEQALYSAEVLSDAEREEFKALVEEITSAAA